MQTLRFSEFMVRTDERLEILLAQSNEWAGVRKTLAAMAAVLTLVGGVVGYLTHYFWTPSGLH